MCLNKLSDTLKGLDNSVHNALRHFQVDSGVSNFWIPRYPFLQHCSLLTRSASLTISQIRAPRNRNFPDGIRIAYKIVDLIS